MIQAPTITITVGGLPEVVCYRPTRAEGRPPRFDIRDAGFVGISGPMLREFFEAEGLSIECADTATGICVAAANALA